MDLHGTVKEGQVNHDQEEGLDAEDKDGRLERALPVFRQQLHLLRTFSMHRLKTHRIRISTQIKLYQLIHQRFSFLLLFHLNVALN